MPTNHSPFVSFLILCRDGNFMEMPHTQNSKILPSLDLSVQPYLLRPSCLHPFLRPVVQNLATRLDLDYRPRVNVSAPCGVSRLIACVRACLCCFLSNVCAAQSKYVTVLVSLRAYCLSSTPLGTPDWTETNQWRWSSPITTPGVLTSGSRSHSRAVAERGQRSKRGRMRRWEEKKGKTIHDHSCLLLFVTLQPQMSHFLRDGIFTQRMWRKLISVCGTHS